MVSQKIVTSFEMLTPRGWSVIGYRAVAVFFFFFQRSERKYLGCDLDCAIGRARVLKRSNPAAGLI